MFSGEGVSGRGLVNGIGGEGDTDDAVDGDGCWQTEVPIANSLVVLKRRLRLW